MKNPNDPLKISRAANTNPMVDYTNPTKDYINKTPAQTEFETMMDFNQESGIILFDLETGNIQYSPEYDPTLDQQNPDQLQDSGLIQLNHIKSEKESNPVSSLFQFCPDSSLIQYDQDSSMFESPDTSMIHSDPSSSLIQYNPDSSMIQFNPDSSMIQFNPDSSMIQFNPDSSMFESPDSSIIQYSQSDFNPIQCKIDPKNEPIQFDQTSSTEEIHYEEEMDLSQFCIEELEPKIICVQADISANDISNEFEERSDSENDFLDISQNYFNEVSADDNSELCKSSFDKSNR